MTMFNFRGTKNDSLEVIGTHVPDNDAKVYYEKVRYSFIFIYIAIWT